MNKADSNQNPNSDKKFHWITEYNIQIFYQIRH